MKKSDRKALVITVVTPLVLIIVGGTLFMLGSLLMSGEDAVAKLGFFVVITTVFFLIMFGILFWSNRVIEDGVYIFKERPERENQ
ncbi:MAG: hypothetical protein GX040_11170 [Alcaligenaceae bacterium]|nr:hypothetical protein [Alcaligenaceae bacterium]